MDNSQGKVCGDGATCEVMLDGHKLKKEESLEYRRHSPDGFSWGFNGSGPAQLAFAILLKLYGLEEAEDYYQDFKNEVIARLVMDDDFEISIESINKWLEKKQGEGLNDEWYKSGVIEEDEDEDY